MFFNNRKKIAFTLAEALMFLLIATLVMVAAMPVITRKHVDPIKLPHGKWACIRDTEGNYYSVSLGDYSDALPAFDKWEPLEGTCKFPRLPETVKSVMVKIVGGGAAGHDARVTINPPNVTENMFSVCEESAENNTSCPTGGYNKFSVPQTGRYRLKLAGATGQKAILNPHGLKLIITGVSTQTCNFDSAVPSPDIPAASFEMELKQNDKIIVRYPMTRRYTLYMDTEGSSSDQNYFVLKVTQNGGSTTKFPSYHYCNHNIPGLARYTVGGVYKEDQMTFQEVEHIPGNSGLTKNFYYQSAAGGPEILLATVYGGGGSYYASQTNLCAYNADLTCENRYQPFVHSPYGGNPLNGVVKGDSSLIIDDTFRAQFVESGTTSSLTALRSTLDLKGGCGGSGGEMRSEFMMRPKAEIEISIGLGGQTPGDPGQPTTFGYMTALGGSGCSSNTMNYNGGEGGVPAYLTEGDSVGGEGNQHGFLNHSNRTGIEHSSTEYYNEELHYYKLDILKGGDGQGIGAGGGGAAIGVDFFEDASKDIENPEVETLVDEDVLKIYTAAPGKGAPGGIIVSW